MKLLLLFAGCGWLSAHAARLCADEQPPAIKRELVATVLGEGIYLEQITPTEAETKRQELPQGEYQKWLLDYRTNLLFGRISGRVLNEYAAREKLSPSDQELDAQFREYSRRRLADPQLDEEAKKKFALRMVWLAASSREWRTANALYHRYGGQVAISSFGACTSIEGRNAVFQDYAAAGDIKFHHAGLEQAFWAKTKDGRVLDVRVSPERIKDFFAVSPWEREFNQ